MQGNVSRPCMQSVYTHKKKSPFYSNHLLLLGRSRFQALREHYAASGLETRIHGNVKRLPANTLTYHERENAMRLIQGYSRANSILLPGRIPGYKKDDRHHPLPRRFVLEAILHLPLQLVWLQYQAACEEAAIRAAAYNTICVLWRTLLPHITVMRPMTDLCFECQKNSTALMRSANQAEEEKSEVCLN